METASMNSNSHTTSTRIVLSASERLDILAERLMNFDWYYRYSDDYILIKKCMEEKRSFTVEVALLALLNPSQLDELLNRFNIIYESRKPLAAKDSITSHIIATDMINSFKVKAVSQDV